MAWQLGRYVHAIHNLTAAFAQEGKRLIITAQGSPLVPSRDEAVLAETLRGLSLPAERLHLQGGDPAAAVDALTERVKAIVGAG